ncbi:MAG: SPFH domain-containing protein [Deltaproteobacteria bacterium]|jgi:hypothetical protein|nr:SPFH domain-containing protein [Deltaproteobacteria bacterium]MBW2534700.1 SPFH domain-containing protein [Deltaproteobacteria bacterium]
MEQVFAQIQAPNQPFDTGLSDRYDDPQYGNTIQVSATGLFTLQVVDPQKIQQLLQQGSDPSHFYRYATETITKHAHAAYQQVGASQHAAARPQLAAQVAQAANAELAAWGLAISSLQLTAETYGYDSFARGFFKKAGPALVVAGLLSIVLSVIGFNLRILLWIDAWGPLVGWGIRVGLVLVGAVIWLLSLDRD